MKKIWMIPAVMAYSFMVAVGAFGQEVAAPLSVTVASPVSPVVTVTASTMSVSGTASGGAGVTRVTWQTSNGATGTASGTGTWEATGIPVTEGNTTIVMRVYDAKGSSAWVALVAVRESATVISSAAKLPQPPAL